jgi:hypothetical protein
VERALAAAGGELLRCRAVDSPLERGQIEESQIEGT